MNLVKEIKKELEVNGNKLSPDFIKRLADNGTVTHVKVTDNTRVCVITLHTGHEVVGYAQVLDDKNDVAEIGQKVAYDNALEEIWRIAGSIAKLVMIGQL